MKKTGFTLAEVLISLAIVGIIAAITIPQIVTAVEKRKVGPTLGRAVEQIELGAQNLIQHYNDGRTDNNYITLLSDIPDLDVKMLASFFGASQSVGTFTENDVKDYIAYNPLSFLMPATYAATSIPGVQSSFGGGSGNPGLGGISGSGFGTNVVKPSVVGNTVNYQYNDGSVNGIGNIGSGVGITNTGIGGYTGAPNVNENWSTPSTTGGSTIKDGNSFGITVTSPTTGIGGTKTCPSGYTLKQQTDGTYTCVGFTVGSTGGETGGENPQNNCAAGFEWYCYNQYATSCQCIASCGADEERKYDANGVPYCEKKTTPLPNQPVLPTCAEGKELVQNSITGEYSCKEPEPSPDPADPVDPADPADPVDPVVKNPNLFRLNKLATEIYFVNGINTSATKPSDVIARILVDYNGTKVKPNTVGKDIYEFNLLNNGKLKAYDDFAKEIVKNGFKTE